MENIEIIIVIAVILFLVMKKMGQVSAEQARKLVEEGAIIIDVRSPSEYADGHIRDAINLPLDSIGSRIEQVVKDRHQPILVYCLSGTRSGIAKRILRGRQYLNVHNLGSLLRARSILQ